MSNAMQQLTSPNSTWHDMLHILAHEKLVVW